MKIENKVAVVVGGARGLGTDFVNLLLKNGAKVAFGDVLDVDGAETVAEFQQKYGKQNVLYQHCDITSADQIKALFAMATKEFGLVEIVANSAGICKEFDWEKTVDVNIGGMIRLSTIALESMSLENGGNGGIIVHTSSLLGIYPAPHSPVYGATKAAIINYCRSFATKEHFALSGVRFNSLLPSHMITKINDDVLEEPINIRLVNFTKERMKTVVEKGTFHSTETCAAALITLIRDDSINGEAVAVTPKRDFVITEPNFAQLDPDYM